MIVRIKQKSDPTKWYKGLYFNFEVVKEYYSIYEKDFYKVISEGKYQGKLIDIEDAEEIKFDSLKSETLELLRTQGIKDLKSNVSVNLLLDIVELMDEKLIKLEEKIK